MSMDALNEYMDILRDVLHVIISYIATLLVMDRWDNKISVKSINSFSADRPLKSQFWMLYFASICCAFI